MTYNIQEGVHRLYTNSMLIYIKSICMFSDFAIHKGQEGPESIPPYILVDTWILVVSTISSCTCAGEEIDLIKVVVEGRDN